MNRFLNNVLHGYFSGDLVVILMRLGILVISLVISMIICSSCFAKVVKKEYQLTLISGGFTPAIPILVIIVLYGDLVIWRFGDG